MIRSKFTHNNQLNPIDILQFLIPKNPNKFHLPPSVKDITDIIKKAKASNSTGNDIITMKIIKKLTPLISPHITHLTTSIIRTQIYPTILKTTCISPNLKSDKPIDSIDSYRPISTIDKIIQ